MKIIFACPEWFYALTGLLLIWYGVIKSEKRRDAIVFSKVPTLQSFMYVKKIFPLKGLPIIIWMFVYVLCVSALARPQLVEAERDFKAEGVDIIIALDISGSMKAEDFQPENRLEVAKEEATAFIKQRKHDRIGLVIFSQYSLTQCPLTLDHDIVIGMIANIHSGMIADGTAIGLALATAVNRLKDSNAKSKVVVLLTDGENNAGQIDPLAAAEIARTFGVRVYTIGVGKGGLVPYPMDDPVLGRRYSHVELAIDEATLRAIAQETNGQYFRARDKKSLKDVYARINQLERTEFKEKRYVSHQELYHWVLLPGLILFFLYIVCDRIFYLTLP